MKVLVAEDDPLVRMLLEGLLIGWGYQVEIAVDGTEAWRILQRKEAPDLAILDWMMPGMDGVQICRELRRRETENYVYVLLLTSKDTKEDVVLGLESGVDDYLTKPFNSDELRARITAGKRIVNLQRQLLQVQEVLRVKATCDGLTGLWNRTTILELLGKHLEKTSENGEPTAVVLADVDHFKGVNDTLGHQAGDAVLQEVARRLATAVRSYDAVGRFGGEEFLIVLPGRDTRTALAVAQQLRGSLADSAIVIPEGTIQVTISLGVASTDTVAVHMDTLIRTVDELLYQAKTAGRNRAVADLS